MTEKIDSIINQTTRAVELKSSIQNYQAGVCNIGAAQREKRRILALYGGMFGFSWPFLGFVFGFPMWLKAIVFLPAFIGVLGFLQYRQQFCAYFGLTNQYNFSDTQKSLKVIDQNNQSKDFNKSIKMVALSLAIGFIYTLLVVLLF